MLSNVYLISYVPVIFVFKLVVILTSLDKLLFLELYALKPGSI